MNVLDHRQRRGSPAKGVEQRASDRQAVFASQREQVSAVCGFEELAQRAQGSRHRQRLACAREERDRIAGDAISKLAHERCLADARLSSDERQRASAVTGRIYDLNQPGKLILTLEQPLHKRRL